MMQESSGTEILSPSCFTQWGKKKEYLESDQKTGQESVFWSRVQLLFFA